MRILFLGETYRADAQTWINGLKEFGQFEIFTWELNEPGRGFRKLFRAVESISRIFELHKYAKEISPDLIIAERTTSYGFIAATLHKSYPIAVAQQGITDIYPFRSPLVPLKRMLQKYAFRHATLVHAWGEAMTYSMIRTGVDPAKIMVLAKGIDLRKYKFQPRYNTGEVHAIVTRSLTPDYRHATILKAFGIIKKRGIPFRLTIVGGGFLRPKLEALATELGIADCVHFTGVIPNDKLPDYLAECDLYISMPCTEGVSSSLFEAFSSGCYPIITDVPGNRAWIRDKINGRLITIDDYEMLAGAIEEYFNNRGELSNALEYNRKMVEEKASYEKNMKAICSRYVEIANQKK
jgi:glycosyltransferase involved in cell wall biosynthesis